MKMLLTKKFVFEMAHALDDYDGKCAHLHGHSYHLEVCVGTSAVGSDGIAIDFSAIKAIVQRTIISRFDHALVLSTHSPFLASGQPYSNLVAVPFNPTTENLLLHFASLLSPCMPPGATLHSLRLSETDTSTAELIL